MGGGAVCGVGLRIESRGSWCGLFAHFDVGNCFVGKIASCDGGGRGILARVV